MKPEELNEGTQLLMLRRVADCDPALNAYNESVSMLKRPCDECKEMCWIADSSIAELAKWVNEGVTSDCIIILCMVCMAPLLKELKQHIKPQAITKAQQEELKDFKKFREREQ